MKLIRYYYYRMYKYFSTGDVVPFFSTFTVISVFFYFNIITLIDIFLFIIGGVKVKLLVVESGVGRLWPALIFLPLYGLFYYYMKRLGHHDKIIDEFKDETKKQKLLSTLFVVTYFVGSIVLFVITFRMK
ncbi:hypothetical protein B0O44_104369 [Pedobacter nutrimenti]|uniref:Uncharacterized protein n=1 Tax=Pedobacter nutrimenti TaxID=1241337 RepID=A0A318UGS3_9SPHI|nr:hypothetical protein B0O44_104369 [Pedobacter nutrimenti]